MISVIIPSRTDKYLQRILSSFEKSQPNSTPQIVVGDNGISADMRASWPSVRFVDVPKDPFVFSRAINLCVAATPSENDLLIIGDDSIITTSDWHTNSVQILERHASYGLISPQIIGSVATAEQTIPTTPGAVVECPKELCFVAILIRRKAWNEIGPMDERFVGYGFDDTDYCIRARAIGWKLGVTSDIIAQHGVGQYEASATFRTHPDVGKLAAMNAEIFHAKYNKG